MKNRFKNLPVKKRYIAFGIIALELASLPAAAQMMDKVGFEARPVVTAVAIPTYQDGLQRFIVLSNAPVSVQSEGMIGDLNVSVHQSGDISGNRFGDKAQLPGDAQNCAAITHPMPSVIYSAARKTAASRGPAVSQAVVFEFSYAPEGAAPKLEFIAGKAKQAPAESCAPNIL